MHIDWLGYGGLAVGVLSLPLAFFAVTNRSVQELLVYWRIRRLPKTFTDIARDYRLADEIPDDLQGSSAMPPSYTRVQRKDILAEGLFRFAQGAAIGRRVLAGSQDHGYVVTLMKLIQAEPRRGDVSLIAKAVKCNVPPHTDWRTLEAVEALIERKLIDVHARNQINDAIEKVASRLDADSRWRALKVMEKFKKM